MSLDKPVLNARRPTGVVPFPFILVEGEEGAGKTWQMMELSKSPRVGAVYILDLGEGSADEYTLEGSDYHVLNHDGTYAQVLEQVYAVKALAKAANLAGEPPVVLCIDTMTDVWDGLKDWVSDRAKAKPANKRKLAADPAADLDVSRNLWNDAGSRYRRLTNALKTFPGIVVATAKGKEVSGTDPSTGQPYRDGRKVYKVEGEKNLMSDASVVLRMTRENPPMIVKARSKNAGVRPGTDEPKVLRNPPENLLDWLVFDILKCDPSIAHVRDYKQFTAGELTDDERGDANAQDAKEATEAQRPSGNPAVSELLAEVAARAQALGIIEQVKSDWAESHNGQPIQGTTDLGALELLRDDLAELVRARTPQPAAGPALEPAVAGPPPVAVTDGWTPEMVSSIIVGQAGLRGVSTKEHVKPLLAMHTGADSVTKLPLPVVVGWLTNVAGPAIADVMQKQGHVTHAVAYRKALAAGTPGTWEELTTPTDLDEQDRTDQHTAEPVAVTQDA